MGPFHSAHDLNEIDFSILEYHLLALGSRVDSLSMEEQQSEEMDPVLISMRQ